MNTLHSSLQDYLALRRPSLGFKMSDAGRMLPGFVSFLEERHKSHITAQSALEWAQQADVQPAEWARRLGFVRGFARYRSAVDPLTEVPASELLPHRSTRARPYLYSEEEVQRLLAAALQLPTDRSSSALRPWTFHCLLGLLSVTGLRISEALDLKLGDVDMQQAVLTIHAAKLGRWRLVPLHPTTCAVLAEYMRRREDFLGLRDSIYLFVSTKGTRLDGGRVHRAFYELSRQTGLRAPGVSRGPRLHDFRHRFAVMVLTRWYQAGIDPQRHLPVLSTFLGHVYVQGTYWYLSGARNLRLTAVHSFFRYVAFEAPANAAQTQRVLAIPAKRFTRTLVPFLRRPEVDALLAAPDQQAWSGRRDHALILLAVQTGLRLSELTNLRPADLQLGAGANVHVIGKGRKERCTPLSKSTRAVLTAWLREPPKMAGQPVFPNAQGGRLSAHGVHYLLAKHVATAATTCPSLKSKRVSPHVLRHTTAMDLLQEGVDRSVIALWLGHESIETTQMYLDADLELKQRVLDRTTPPTGRPGRYRPDDKLLEFLKGL